MRFSGGREPSDSQAFEPSGEVNEGRKYKELRGVVIWGPRRVVTELVLVDRIENVMRTKYKEQEWKASEMPASWVEERKAEKRGYIEINPTQVSSWDNSRIA